MVSHFAKYAQAPAYTAVRQATHDDMAAITRIYAHYVLNTTSSFEEEAPGQDEMLRRFQMSTSRGLPYLVAEDDGGVAGFCFAGIYKDRAAYRYTVEDSIFIEPNRTGAGMGRLLLGTLIEQCQEMGLRQMMAVIADSNNQGSIRLHASLGFEQIGIGRNLGCKHGQWLDIVYMQCDLTKR